MPQLSLNLLYLDRDQVIALGGEDMAIAARVYREALRTHVGTELKYW